MTSARYCLLFVFCAGIVFAQTPTIVPGGVINAASFDKTPGAPVAPGQLISIFGTDLAANVAPNDTVPLSTSLADTVSVKFNGVTAGLDYVSPTLINAQVPWNVLPDGTNNGTATVVVTRNGVSGPQSVVNVGPTAPGVFAIPPGVGYAVAINAADGAISAPPGQIPGINTHPAKAGDVLIVYATGLGPVDSPIANGADSLDKLRNTIARPTVFIGGVSATVAFSGLSPQFPGVNQLNIVVPPGIPPSNSVPLQIQVNGGPVSTNQVVIAVQ